MGNLLESGSGEPLLVNAEGRAFLAGDLAIAIWKMCDGETDLGLIVARVCELASVSPEIAGPLVEGVLERMERAQLMKTVEG
jgi:hypothetical protein